MGKWCKLDEDFAGAGFDSGALLVAASLVVFTGMAVLVAASLVAPSLVALLMGLRWWVCWWWLLRLAFTLLVVATLEADPLVVLRWWRLRSWGFTDVASLVVAAQGGGQVSRNCYMWAPLQWRESTVPMTALPRERHHCSCKVWVCVEL